MLRRLENAVEINLKASTPGTLPVKKALRFWR